MAQYIDDDLPLPPFGDILRIIENKDNSNKTMKSNDGKEGEETKGRWTPEEHRLFLEGVMLYGKDWKKMQALIRTRSLVQIRTHAQKVFKKVAIKRNPDDATIKLNDDIDDDDDDHLDGDVDNAVASSSLSSSSSSANRLSKAVNAKAPLGFSSRLTKSLPPSGSSIEPFSSNSTTTVPAATLVTITAPESESTEDTNTSAPVPVPPVSPVASVPSTEIESEDTDPPQKRTKI